MENVYPNFIQTQQLTGLPTLIPEMHLVESLLYEVTGSGKGTTYEMCRYLLQSGGKRLRPLLVILCGKALVPYPNNINMLVTAGVAAELIHMASLVHDDVIDESPCRRGKASLHSLWSKKHAVLAGDFLFAKAFDLMVTHELYSVLKLMVTAIEEMCEGEIEQQNQMFGLQQNETDYFNRINKKTAKLLAACCESGAIISGGDQISITALRNYGTNLGFVFQIVDDMLDFTGQSDIMGKPIGQDLAQGNLTLPVIYLVNDPKYGAWIKKVITNRLFDQSTIDSVTKILEKTGLLQQTLNVAKHCAQTAKKELTILSGGIYLDMLEHLVDKALERKA